MWAVWARERELVCDACCLEGLGTAKYKAQHLQNPNFKVLFSGLGDLERLAKEVDGHWTIRAATENIPQVHCTP